MTSKNKNKPPLVAEQRYPKPGGKPAKMPASTPAAKKPTTQSAKGSKKRPTRRKPKTRLGRALAGLRRLTLGMLRLVWRFSVRITLAVTAIIAVAVIWFAATLPPVSAQLDARARGSVTFLDRDRKVFTWRGDQFGGVIRAETVSPHLKNAVVAAEDKRFYRHLGLSPRGIASAVRINLAEGRGPLSGHGGSTITQQTAKLLCLGTPFDPQGSMTEAEFEADCRQTTIARKFKEAIYSLAMELRYSKDDILTIYLNRVFLGAGARGFEAAAQRYFSKPAANLQPAEAAMLAGLLVAPTRYAPTNNLQRSQDRAATIARLMRDQGYLTPTQAAKVMAEPATLSETAAKRIGDYFADWVMSTGPAFLTRDTTEDVVIRTTFDPNIQAAAEAAMRHIFDTRVREGSQAQAAIIVMSADGAVRAIVGGRDTGIAGAFNRATQARRQTGSVFKPFVYAAALDLGHSSQSTVDDKPLTIDIPGSGLWSPKNYGDKYMGRVTLTTALAYSLNSAAVRVSEYAGRENVRQIASDFGITSDLADGPALALGASEASLLETTGAYAGILNGGQAVRPYGVIEVRLQGEDDPIMGLEGGIGARVISQDAARELTWMMTRVIEDGTGRRARLAGWQAAGKTGTTQAARDAWFVGFTAEYVAGVWMGYDDNTPLTGVTGGGLPADIWREAMARIHEGIPISDLPVIRRPETRSIEDLFKPRRARSGQERTPETIIRDLLRAIFGGN